MSGVVIFPGQGSQQVGMLNAVFNMISAEDQAIIKTVFSQAAEILQYDLWDVVQQGPAEKLNQTEITQPALLVTSVALWRVWASSHPAKQSIVAMAGHSLGEYSALVCANALSFADGIKLVAARGKYMQEAVLPGEGAMAAIIGLSPEEIETICKIASEGDIISAANINAPGQIVISGHARAVDRAIDAAKSQGAKLVKKLDVSVPSHCDLMKPAAQKLLEILENTELTLPSVPVIQNAEAKSYSTPAEIKRALFGQLYRPVRWVDSIEYMINQFSPTQIIECGPGKVLTGLNKRIVPKDKNIDSISVEDFISKIEN